MKVIDILQVLLKRKKELIAIILIMIITGLFYFPIIKDITHTIISENDWFQNYYYAGMPRKIILQHCQLPLRTPYLGGGYPSIAHPYDYILSPFFLFVLFFGEVAGLRLLVFLIFIFSALGMFYLTRYVLKYNIIGSAFSSLTFALCNWGAYEVVDGNIERIFCYLTPWLWAFFIKSKEDRRFIVFSCFVLSLILTHSGLSLIPILSALFIFACLSIVGIKRGFRIHFDAAYLIVFLIIVTACFLLCAIKILPIYQLYTMRIEHIHLPYEDSYSLISRATKAFGACLNVERLWKSLLDRDFLGYSVMYLGPIPLIILFLSFLVYRTENIRYLFLLLIFTLIQFGPNSPVDLFKILWHIHPVIHGIWRLDKYFGFYIPFFISIIAGRFFLIFEKRRKALLLGVAIVIIGIGNMFWNNKIIFKNLVYERKPILKEYNSFFQVEIEDAKITRTWPGFSEVKDIRCFQPFWLLLRQNVGVVNFNFGGNLKLGQYTIPKYILETGEKIGECVYVKGYERLPKEPDRVIDLISAGEINPSYRGETFFLSEENKAELAIFSPNRIEVDVELQSPDKLVINQNYHKSWRSDKGILISHKGLLAVEVADKGSYKVKLNYVPLEFYVGSIISLLTFIGMMGYLIHPKKISS